MQYPILLSNKRLSTADEFESVFSWTQGTWVQRTPFGIVARSTASGFGKDPVPTSQIFDKIRLQRLMNSDFSLLFIVYLTTSHFSFHNPKV